MQADVIRRLFQSFTELEAAISSARQTLATQPEKAEGLVERLDSYGGILSKQRKLAEELCALMTEGKWDEVTRHVGLINGLSSLIRDDARAILSSLSAQPTETAEDLMPIC